MPPGLIAFLQANPTGLVKADCFTIALPTGQTLCVTEGQWDITCNAGKPGWTREQTTFKATQYGRWSRGAITSEAGFKLAAGTMKLTCIPQQGTTYPGLDMGMAEAALAHLFDASTVWCYTAYFFANSYGDVTNGIETKFQGTITKVPKIGRNIIQFDVADPLYLLGLKVPSRLMQANCGWSFCDANCTLSAAAYTVDFTAASGSTQTVLTPATAFTQAAGYFTQGVIKCLTGANAGLSQTVKVHASGNLTTFVPWILPVAPGDTFSVIKGCDKTITTCTTQKNAAGTTTDNSSNHGGTPLVPPSSQAF